MTDHMHDNALSYVGSLKEVLDKVDWRAVDRLADLLFDLWQDDRQVIVFGNGGSACTASHYVADVVKTAAVAGERPLRALSLVDNTGLMTAVGNDNGYGQTFAYSISAFARPGDTAIAISGSGNSPNVVGACRAAKDRGVTLVCLTGFDGGQISHLADLHIHVPSDNYGVIEDIHLSIGHMITQALKAKVTAKVAVHS